MALDALQRWWDHIRDRGPRRALVGALLVALAIGAGVGGYLVGSSPDVDLETARLSAAEDGREAGAKLGESEGYQRGVRKARERTYDAVYAEAYRAAYAEEFESAGLDAPETIRVVDRR